MSRIGSTHSAWKKVCFGTFLILLWIGFASFTILTTEDLIKGGNGRGVIPSWHIMTQLWDLVQGIMGGIEVVAVLGAWAIFTVYIASSVAEWLTDGGTADSAFKTICWIIILIDGYANWNYLRILPRPEYQWLVTLIIFFVIVYCGKKGFNLALEGLGEMGN